MVMASNKFLLAGSVVAAALNALVSREWLLTVKALEHWLSYSAMALGNLWQEVCKSPTGIEGS